MFLSWLVGSGRGSRLYKRLVNELGIATEVESFAYDLFEHGLFFVQVQPQNIDDIPAIIKHVKEEVQKMLQDGFLIRKLIVQKRRLMQTTYLFLRVIKNLRMPLVKHIWQQAMNHIC